MAKKTNSATRRGVDLLHDPQTNKSTAYTNKERDKLGLRGLLPPRVISLETQVTRVLQSLHRKVTDLEKYIYLMGLQDRNETLFYRTALENLPEILPIIYTPTVGQACQEYGNIFRRPHGMFISTEDKGNIKEVLRNWPQPDVRVIVVTDGERILGLGDLGANGMGIPVGKLSLYTACAGIQPSQCLPITIDAGTNNEQLLQDPLYIGLPHPRIRGAEYDALIDEFMDAVQEVFPKAMVQLEDFGNQNAFRLLHKYRDTVCTFDDDIQGTGGVALAGLLSALRMIKGKLNDQTILFLGAGEAGIGIADLIVSAMVSDGMNADEARKRCWFVDSKGLVVDSRTDLVEHKRPYAHKHPFIKDLSEAIDALKPTVLIGVSGQPRTFTPAVLQKMAKYNKRPIIFALSNPTSKSECTAEECYQNTEGRGIFASGSPFPPVVWKDKSFVPGQANNAYIFPGVGLGIVASGAKKVTDDMFLEAARALDKETSEDDLAQGRIFPSFNRIREVSLSIAEAVAKIAYEYKLATEPKPKKLREHIRSLQYDPTYESYE